MNASLQPAPRPDRRPARPSAFTMVELMTVLAIIVILITILIPTVKKVRDSSRVAGARNQVIQIDSAVQRFQLDHGRYPGPLTDDQVGADVRGTGAAPVYYNGSLMQDRGRITQAENLVLGLYGGFKWVTPGPQLTYDPQLVGKGMIGMNPQQPKKSPAYLDDLKMLSSFEGNTSNWTPGPFTDGAGSGSDSRVPELVDVNFTSPMPILYLRARVGAGGIIRDDVPTSPNQPLEQYSLSDIAPYVGETGTTLYKGSIGESKRISANDYVNSPITPTAGVLPHGLRTVDKNKTMTDKKAPSYQYPYNAWAYFSDPADPRPVPDRQSPRKKDGFILISAGLDRVYGTADDITNFGSVLPD